MGIAVSCNSQHRLPLLSLHAGRAQPRCSHRLCRLPPLNEQIRPCSDPPPVWPWKKGTARGIAFHPLYPSVPEAAERIPALALALLEERLQP